MTAKSYKKAFNQIKNKKVKLTKYLKHNMPKKRTTGKGKNLCKLCGRRGGHISRYGLHICRQCFRDNALNIGFKNYR